MEDILTAEIILYFIHKIEKNNKIIKNLLELGDNKICRTLQYFLPEVKKFSALKQFYDNPIHFQFMTYEMLLK